MKLVRKCLLGLWLTSLVWARGGLVTLDYERNCQGTGHRSSARRCSERGNRAEFVELARTAQKLAGTKNNVGPV